MHWRFSRDVWPRHRTSPVPRTTWPGFWQLVPWTSFVTRGTRRAGQESRRARTETRNIWNTLGVALYRAGEWKSAIEALTKSMVLLPGQNESFNTLFLAMAHGQLGDKPQGHSWYDKAVKWMDKNQPKDEELIRFRAEAAALLGVNEKKD